MSPETETIWPKEQRTLGQILKNQTLEHRSVFNCALAALTLAIAQYNSAYLVQERPELIAQNSEAQQFTDIDPKCLEDLVAAHVLALHKAHGLEKTDLTAIVHRIGGQQDSFFQNSDITVADLQFFNTSFYLTAMELTNPDDYQIYPGQVDRTRQLYRIRREGIPPEKFLPAVAFTNELREAVGLPPLA